jgi:hypothetical protein
MEILSTEEKEQLIVNLSHTLAQLTDAAVAELPVTTQNLVHGVIMNGGNLFVMSELLPRPSFRIVLMTPDGKPIELGRCAPSHDALCPPKTVSH